MAYQFLTLSIAFFIATFTYSVTMSDPETWVYIATNIIAGISWVVLGLLIHKARTKYATEPVKGWMKRLSYALKIFCGISLLRCAANIALVFHIAQTIQATIFIMNNLSLGVAVGYASIYYKHLPGFISRLARHQRMSRRFDSIAEASADAFFEVDRYGSIWYANRAAAEIFGYEQKSLLGLNVIDDLISESDRPVFEKMREDYQMTGQPTVSLRHYPTKLRGLRQDGKEFTAEITASRYADPDLKNRFTVIIRDISYREQLEKELAKTV